MIGSFMHTYSISSSSSSSSLITSLSWWRHRITGKGFLFVGKSDGSIEILSRNDNDEQEYNNNNNNNIASSASVSSSNNFNQSDFKVIDIRKKFSEDKSVPINCIQAVDKWNILLCLIDGKVVSHSLSFSDDMKKFLEKEPPVYQNEKGCYSFDANVLNDTLIIGMKKRIVVLKRLSSSLSTNMIGSINSYFQLLHVINIESGTIRSITSNYRNTWLGLSEQYLIMNNDSGKIISYDLSSPLLTGLQKKPVMCIVRNDYLANSKLVKKNLNSSFQNNNNSSSLHTNEVVLLVCDSIGHYVCGDQADQTIIGNPTTITESEFYFRATNKIQWSEPPVHIISIQPYLIVLFPQSIDIYASSTGTLLQRYNAFGYSIATCTINDPCVGSSYDNNIPASIFLASDKQILELKLFSIENQIMSILNDNNWPSIDIVPKYQQQQQQSQFFRYNLSLSLCMDIGSSPWRAFRITLPGALGLRCSESQLKMLESYIHGRYGISLFKSEYFERSYEHFNIALSNKHVALEWAIELFSNSDIFSPRDMFLSYCQTLRDCRIKRLGEFNRDESNDILATPSGRISTSSSSQDLQLFSSIGNYNVICFDAPAKEGRMTTIPINQLDIPCFDTISLSKAIKFVLLPILFQHRDSLLVARSYLSGTSYSHSPGQTSPPTPSSPISAAKTFSLSNALSHADLSLNRSASSQIENDSSLVSRKRSIILLIEDELRIIDSIIFRACILTPESILNLPNPINLWESSKNKSHLTKNSSIQAPLLSVRKTYFLLDNFCSIDDCEKILLIYPEAWMDLVWVYFGKTYHEKCLSWLQKRGTNEKQNDGEIGPYVLMTVQYLQCLGPQHVHLIIEYSRWIFEIDTNIGLSIFIPSEKGFKFGFPNDDIRNQYARLGELDSSLVIKYLNDLDSTLKIPPKIPSELDVVENYLEIRYLEYLLEKVRDDSSIFHNRLGSLYLDAYIRCSDDLNHAKENDLNENDIILLSKRKEYFQERQVRFLSRSQHYIPNDLISKAKESGDPKSLAIVLNKMGRHLDALNVYAAESTQSAEEYCMKISDLSQRKEVYLSLLNRVLGNRPMVLNSESSTNLTSLAENINDNNYQKQKIYQVNGDNNNNINDIASNPSNRKLAIDLLNRKSSEFDPVQAIKAMPDDTPILELLQYLETSLREIEDRKSKNLVERQLLKQENMRSRQMLYEEHKKFTIIKRTTICKECNRYFQDGVTFLRTSEGNVYHYACYKKKSKS